ncbi:partial prephenate dehydrogenase [Anaerolineae bacterium]|nr:partial prephenate dehydrogenase [Anaerolineae bacterium]
MIDRLCVIGVGLIGGSIAMAARGQGLCREIVGVDADGLNLGKALELGVIDSGLDAGQAGGIAKAAQGADWVVIATPVGTLRWVFEELKPVWSGQAVYTDAGSTKLSVVQALQEVFEAVPSNFVPGHPIAGAERSGVEASTSTLYRGKQVVLTPLLETDDAVLAKVEAFWAAMGADVSLMTPGHHDEMFAATSHLPHVLAYALVHMLGRKDEQEEIFQYAGAGFRDFTRIASSSPKMWGDICMANRSQIIPLLASLGEELKQVSALMENPSPEALFKYFAEARDARQRFLYQLEK